MQMHVTHVQKQTVFPVHTLQEMSIVRVVLLVSMQLVVIVTPVQQTAIRVQEQVVSLALLDTISTEDRALKL